MSSQKPSSKRNFWDDSIEALHETGKTVVENVNYALNPFADAPEGMNSQNSQQQEAHQKMMEQHQKGPNNTPLDFDKLDRQYKTQDEANYEALHQRFFRSIKNKEEQLLEEEKQRKAEEERQEEMEKKQKEKQAKEQVDYSMPTSVKKGPNAGGGRKKADPMEDMGGSTKH